MFLLLGSFSLFLADSRSVLDDITPPQPSRLVGHKLCHASAQTHPPMDHDGFSNWM